MTPSPTSTAPATRIARAIDRAAERPGTKSSSVSLTRDAAGLDAPSVLDWTRLRGLFSWCDVRGDEAAEVAGLLDVFLVSLRDLIDRVESAVREGDLAELESAAHSLKGAAASFGAERLSVTAARLERAARLPIGPATRRTARILAAEAHYVCGAIERRSFVAS